MNEKRQLGVLYQISRALVGKQDLDAILQQVVVMTANLVGSKVCSLMLLDSARNALHPTGVGARAHSRQGDEDHPELRSRLLSCSCSCRLL